MATQEQEKDNWSTEAYQHSASFVPKLATTVMQWLDPQKDDIILDIGCGDGVLDVQMAEILKQGAGSVHGIDASPAMIEAAKKSVAAAGVDNKCTFEVLNAHSLASRPHLQDGHFTKVFSNAALHWVLGEPGRLNPDSPATAHAARVALFEAAARAVHPGGIFAFELGGLGNVPDVMAAVLGSMGRRLPGGVPAAAALNPWFFPDEAWARRVLETEAGGGGLWKVERAERPWRPTVADRGGIDGWVRLMAASFFEALPAGPERDGCVREVIDVLEAVCAVPGGGFMLSYVRLRVLARRL